MFCEVRETLTNVSITVTNTWEKTSQRRTVCIGLWFYRFQPLDSWNPLLWIWGGAEYYGGRSVWQGYLVATWKWREGEHFPSGPPSWSSFIPSEYHPQSVEWWVSSLANPFWKDLIDTPGSMIFFSLSHCLYSGEQLKSPTISKMATVSIVMVSNTRS